MLKGFGVLAAGCAVMLGASAPSLAAEPTPDGPATLMNRWTGASTLEGLPPQVLMAVEVVVGPGSRAGTIRVRAGVRGQPSVVGEPFALPAAPGTYTVPAPRINGDYRDVRVGIDQTTGGHAIVEPHACRPDVFWAGDPCRTRFLDVFPGPPAASVDGAASSSLAGRQLRLKAIHEVDADEDQRGDESEDRTDLRLRTRSRRGAAGRLRTTVTVKNAGRVAATIPMLRASRSAVIRMRWSSTCRAPRERWTCRLPSIRPGQSRSVTLISEPRRRPRTIRIELSAEGKDLKPADNVKVLRVTR